LSRFILLTGCDISPRILNQRIGLKATPEKDRDHDQVGLLTLGISTLRIKLYLGRRHERRQHI
jgi:hypothetical protein